MSRKKSLDLKRMLRNATAEERASLLDGLPHEVGFGKPPPAHRFSSAHQPRGRGRRNGAENLATILAEELAARVDVTEGGRRKKQSKHRILVKQAINRATTGDQKATEFVIDAQRKAGLLGTALVETSSLFDERDRQVMERFIDVLTNVTPDAGDTGSGGHS